MPRPRGDVFQQEIEPHLDALHRTAIRLTRDQSLADDLLQETLLKAFRFFHSFTAGTNFKAWIFRVLYTVFVSLTREKRVLSAEIDAVPEIEAPEPLEDELKRPTAAERERAVLEAVDDRIKLAIDELPPDLRMVFMLSTVEGLKYREIAEVMGCPLGTVMSRLFRSRRLLQDRLASFARPSGFDTDPTPAGKRAS